eukprot:1330986-Pleurochrysis_carterae.AAC.1
MFAVLLPVSVLYGIVLYSFSTTNLHVRTRYVCPRETEPPNTRQSACYSLVFTLQTATQALYNVPLNTHSRAQVRLAEEEARSELTSLADFGSTSNRNDAMTILVDRLGLEEQIMPGHGRSIITAVVSGVALMTIRETRENAMAKLRWREICMRSAAWCRAAGSERGEGVRYLEGACFPCAACEGCDGVRSRRRRALHRCRRDMNNHHPDLSLATLAEQTFTKEYGLLVAEERRDRAADGKKERGRLRGMH